MLLMYLSPVLVAVLAPRVLGEVVPPTTKVALALAAVGLVLLARPQPGTGTGVVLAVHRRACCSRRGRWSARRWSPTWVGCGSASPTIGIAGLVLAPWALLAEWGEPQASWSWLLVLGLGMTALLGPLYLVVLDRLPASTASVLLYLEPVSALLLAWLFLGEDPGGLTLVGGALIVAGGIIVLRQPTVADTEVLSHVPG